MPSDRREFHNPLRGLLSHAAGVMPDLPEQGEMQALVDLYNERKATLAVAA